MVSKLQAMTTKSNASGKCSAYNTPNGNTKVLRPKKKNVIFVAVWQGAGVQGGDAELQEPRLLRVPALPGPVRRDGPGTAKRQPTTAQP